MSYLEYSGNGRPGYLCMRVSQTFINKKKDSSTHALMTQLYRPQDQVSPEVRKRPLLAINLYVDATGRKMILHNLLIPIFLTKSNLEMTMVQCVTEIHMTPYYWTL